MPSVDLLIFHRESLPDDPPLTALLLRARVRLARRHARMFRQAGVDRVVWVPGDTRAARGAGARTERGSGATSGADERSGPGGTFGDALADALSGSRVRRAVILGSGAVPRLRETDARRLVEAASAMGRRALTNNRYSSDVCAISDARALWTAPPLRNDNVLPRWLEESARFSVAELPGRQRLALDLDSPLDLALLALAPRGRRLARALAPEESAPVIVPRVDELRALAADPRRELLVSGRSSSRTLAWLERHARCRVRFLAEERGMRAGAAATGEARGAEEVPGGFRPSSRPPRSVLGRLLAPDGPEALADRVAELADGALIDTRVLLADRLGIDEAGWPAPEDRFASDLLRADDVRDPWLRALTSSAAASPLPILLGGHSLVGPGVRLLAGRH